MRKPLRKTLVALLLAVWPQLGCVLPGDRTVQQTPPIEQKHVTAQKVDFPQSASVQPPQNPAEALLRAGRTPEAIAYYQQLQRSGGPQGLDATRRLALLYQNVGDTYHAELEYERLNQHNPKDVDVLCTLGWIYYQRGLYSKSWKYLHDAVYLQENHPTADYRLAIDRLGMALAQTNDYENSIKEFKKIGTEAEAYRKVAFVLKLQNKREYAINAYRQAVALDPKNLQLRQELAMLIESVPAYNNVVAAKPTTPPASERRGAVELEEAPLPTLTADAGGGRLMIQRITLPPLPVLDLTPGNGDDWESSKKKIKN